MCFYKPFLKAEFTLCPNTHASLASGSLSYVQEESKKGMIRSTNKPTYLAAI